jgi:hypothetical protein
VPIESSGLIGLPVASSATTGGSLSQLSVHS